MRSAARHGNINANTARLEIVTFDALDGGPGLGLIEPGVDSTGMLTGGTSTLLTSMPGNADAQTAPAYDAAADVFYSRSSTNVVNVVRRSDGSLSGTIVLNFTAAGISAAFNDGIVFVPTAGWLVVLDSGSNRAIAFDLLGNFVGASTLDITVTADSRRPGYANGQLFVFDDARNGWQGTGSSPSGVPAMPTATITTAAPTIRATRTSSVSTRTTRRPATTGTAAR